LFEQIVKQCVEVGLVEGQHLSADGSFVEANASMQSRIPREQLKEAAQVNHTVRQYVQELEQQNPLEEPVHEQDHVSTTEPDSTYATKGGRPARLGYYDNYLVDNQRSVIVDVQATAARMSQETAAAQDMLTRFESRSHFRELSRRIHRIPRYASPPSSVVTSPVPSQRLCSCPCSRPAFLPLRRQRLRGGTNQG
jgi:hypothetical protein